MSQPDDASGTAAHDARAASARGRLGSSTVVRVALVLVVGLAAALLAWLLFVRSDDNGTSAAPTAPSTATPALASLADLRELADSGETFFWAGVQDGTQIELTATDGTVFIRYLPPGEAAGSSRPALTVATYPRSNGFAEVSRAAEDENVSTIELPRGGLAVVDDATDTNVHLAYPDAPYQVEVYAPEPGAARRLVADGTVRSYS